MIFRIELRRSIAPWAGLALLVVALCFLFLMPGPWWKVPAPLTANTTTTALWLRFLLVFLWPIAVGAGAIQGMRDSRSGVVELLATTSRPGWHRAVRLAGAVGASSALGFLLVFGVGLVEVLGHGGFVSVSFVPVVFVAMLAVVAGSWAGLAVGRLLPHPLTAPALAVLTLVASIVAWASLEAVFTLPYSRLGLLAPALGEPRGALVTTSTAVDLGQIAWFAGLAATGFLLLAANSVRARLLGLLPVVAGAAIALPVLPASAPALLTLDGIAAQEVCDGPICVSRAHEDRLAALAGPGREALAMLAKLPGAPTRVEEQAGPTPVLGPAVRDPGVVYLNFQLNDVLLTAGADDLRLAVLSGAGVPSCVHPYGGGGADLAARMIAAAYFTGELKPLPEFGAKWFLSESGQVDRAWATFRALPAEVQRARVIALRQVLLTCRGDPLDTLVPGASR
ncbi:hypothetical protein SAMN05421837_103862 [Amycolatopsis pretoriensis]|uniref:ABC-type transport system involved in multi-copper enzyme maturation, permease component n=1 Tax=Amycolatopsis pretoriensis TaxID=218821 RepID=A0A1H5QNN5_9PSEU|nr:hypothetical protein [Amycolatopsis pretoriensis]SEF27454.1 hypothetical protein SAMN05421837_103862 [Amycolatopsis pretoriensis]